MNLWLAGRFLFDKNANDFCSIKSIMSEDIVYLSTYLSICKYTFSLFDSGINFKILMLPSLIIKFYVYLCIFLRQSFDLL